MASWKFLYELLHDENMSAHEIVNTLNVKPSRLKRMLHSKRLVARLASIKAVSDKKTGRTIVSNITPAIHKMSELINSERPETARKACLNMLDAAREVFEGQGAGTGDLALGKRREEETQSVPTGKHCETAVRLRSRQASRSTSLTINLTKWVKWAKLNFLKRVKK